MEFCLVGIYNLGQEWLGIWAPGPGRRTDGSGTGTERVKTGGATATNRHMIFNEIQQGGKFLRR